MSSDFVIVQQQTMEIGRSKTPYLDILVGKEIIVVEAKDPNLKGVKGKVIDETKNLLVLETSTKTVRLLKSAIKFKLLQTGEIIFGLDIQKRSMDRIKGK